MAPSLPITIIGGGLAGLTLGIALRQRDVPVTLFEAGGYPRHRVCGEFICGNGIEVLRELGLHSKFLAAGAIEARSASASTQARVLVMSSRFAVDTGATRKPRWPSAVTSSSDVSFDSASRNGVAPTP